ncbi:MAG: FliI/YscN family ATPase [Bdellovibrionales bacterium]|nr:FliI/YscN family ATPase [Bdellovibrionales bacterium]
METNEGFQFNLARHFRGIEFANLFHESGRVKKVLGPIVEGTLPNAVVGGVCMISQRSMKPIEAEVVGFRDRTAILMPLEAVDGVSMGARIEQQPGVASVKLGDWMIGRLLNGNGLPVGAPDAASEDVKFDEVRGIRGAALTPMERRTINDRLELGVRSLDATIPLGLGQRVGIMAASGVGKSVLMGMIAKQSKADINVIALIGERGREVTEFLERDLGPEGMKKSIVIAVTSDESPVLRVRGANLATTIAEYFRDKGQNVLLMMDSVTRFAMALREIGLAAGEPPTTKGYTPSVFAQMPRLLERAGARKAGGSITGLYTVLVEGNDFDDPIADNVRSIVDGHILLSRDLASKNFYPAIDVLGSVSRLANAVTNPEEKALNAQVRSVLATYKSAEDLINIGAYRKGNNPEWDRAIDLYPKVIQFLQQSVGEPAGWKDSFKRLAAIFATEVKK